LSVVGNYLSSNSFATYQPGTINPHGSHRNSNQQYGEVFESFFSSQEDITYLLKSMRKVATYVSVHYSLRKRAKNGNRQMFKKSS